MHTATALPSPASPATPWIGPLGAERPAGPDLALTDVAALERAARPALPSGLALPGHDASPAEPDWPLVRERAESLMTTTRDLRVAILWGRAALATVDTGRLRDALVLIAAWLHELWDSVHPVPDAAEDPQADERRGLLSTLSPEAGRAASTAEAEGVSRDLRRLALIGPPWTAQRGLELEASLQALDDIHRAFLARTGAGCRLQALEQGLRQALRSVAAACPVATTATSAPPAPSAPSGRDAGCPGTPPGDAAPPPPHPPGQATAGPTDFPARTRDDVVDDLHRIAAWIRRCEPSSPAPLFVDRAAALLRMDFAGIVRALLPGAGERLDELVGPAPAAERR